MYYRAPRVLRFAEGGSTEEHVGPGSYQVPFLKQQATGGYAPFLSLTARESTFIVGFNTEKDIPGPGHYNVSEKQYNIKGGCSLQNQEERFKKFISDSPGPASYDLSCLGTLYVIKRKVLQAKEHLQSKISRSPYVFRSVSVPSIPSSGQSYGYDINEDDGIVKHFPPASDSTLGPAYYKPQFVAEHTAKNKAVLVGWDKLKCEAPPREGWLTQDFCSATLKYKGVHFGNSLGRLELPIKSGPGPGQYDIIQKKTHYENVNIKTDQQKKYCLHLPRFYEVIKLQEEKKVVPGPGKYNIKSQFQKTESMTPNVNDASHAFLSKSQRFKPVKSTTPGPGTYDESQTAFKYLEKAPTLKNIPFGKSIVRFTQDFKTKEMPGPGFYNAFNNTIIDNFSNMCVKKQRKSVFGSSVPRTFFLDQKETVPTLGPAD